MALAPPERQALLRLARDAVADAARGVRPEPARPLAAALLEPAGAFVSLHLAGQLRGCIGTFESAAPLYQTVVEMARSAAVGDPRFPPVKPREVPELEIEVSVLSPLRLARAEEVEVGRHGVYLVRGAHRGVLLPQVAVEYGWDRQTFLDQTCRKAGLPQGAWREGASIYLFEAEVFGEAEER